MPTMTLTRKRGRKARKEVGVNEFREQWGQNINRAALGEERIVVTRHGLAVAALVSIDDLKQLESGEAA